MEAHVRLTGNVGGSVEFRKPTENLGAWATFRVAVTPRYRGADGQWVDRNTTWLTVNCRNRLAYNVNNSLTSGCAVVVVGRLRTRTWVDKESGQPREQLEVEADLVGHDLNKGTAGFARNPKIEESNPNGNRGGDDPWNAKATAEGPGDADTGEVSAEDLERQQFEEAFGSSADAEPELATAAG